MSIHVFLGPSLPVDDARRILDATYHPPVSAGDVLRLMARRPRVIAIVDGFFERMPAVWHKEILFALSQGVHVLGAASMGALRAAELHAFGMRGVGRIFEAFRDGRLEDDDEVAVAHATAEERYRPLSDPMIHLREALRLARQAGILSAASEATLLDRAKATFYPERSWTRLLRESAEVGVEAREVDALRAMFPAPPDLKRADTVALLEVVRDQLGPEPAPHPPGFHFHATVYWHRLMQVEAPVGGSRGSLDVACAALGRHVRLVHPERQDLLREALVMLLTVGEARRTGPSGDEDVEPDEGRRSPHGFLPPPPADLAALADRALDEMARQAGARLDVFLAAALARRGELAPVLAAIERKQQALDEAGVHVPSLQLAGVDLEALSGWYEARFGALTTAAEDHARGLGFGSWEEFLSEVIAEYLAHR